MYHLTDPILPPPLHPPVQVVTPFASCKSSQGPTLSYTGGPSPTRTRSSSTSEVLCVWCVTKYGCLWWALFRLSFIWWAVLLVQRWPRQRLLYVIAGRWEGFCVLPLVSEHTCRGGTRWVLTGLDSTVLFLHVQELPSKFNTHSSSLDRSVT